MFGCNVGQCYDTRWANTAGQTAAVPMLQGRSLGLERLGLVSVLKVERLGLVSVLRVQRLGLVSVLKI